MLTELGALAEGFAHSVERLRQVATNLVLDGDDRGDERVISGCSVGQTIERLVQAQPQRDLLRRPTKLRCRWLRALLRYQRKRLRNAEPSPKPGCYEPDCRWDLPFDTGL